jgi:Ca2+-binding EF-hand superfamily protein
MKRLTGYLLCGLYLATHALAQEAPAAPPPRPPPPSRPAGADVDNANMLRLSRQMDANADLLVDEKEFTAGFKKLEQDAAKVRGDLVAWLDKDRNGSLSPEELRPFYTAMALLPFLRGIDQNGDTALQEPELDAAFARMAEFCQNSNEQMLEQFDRDRDGKLSEAELQVARQGLQRAGPRGPRGAGGPDAAGRNPATRADVPVAAGGQP